MFYETTPETNTDQQKNITMCYFGVGNVLWKENIFLIADFNVSQYGN